MSASRIITGDDGRLDNVHPGDVLREDFLIGGEIPVAEVSAGTGITAEKLEAILAGKQSIDANSDLRLGRYFGVSEGFFLRLQISYDLEQVRRGRSAAEIDRIVPRAA